VIGLGTRDEKEGWEITLLVHPLKAPFTGFASTRTQEIVAEGGSAETSSNTCLYLVIVSSN
jgi:hypothetical protein